MTEYRVVGTTDDVTDCQREGCPKTNLKCTVVLRVLDADGNDEEQVYYGTECAARVLGTTATAARRRAEVARSNLSSRVKDAREKLALYEPIEGDRRATADLFFGRNPHMRGKGSAGFFVFEMLRDARAALAEWAALTGKPVR